jgi:hypothetical protein
MIDHRRTHPNNPAARPVTQGVLPAGEVLMTVAEVAALPGLVKRPRFSS